VAAFWRQWKSKASASSTHRAGNLGAVVQHGR
jgi:hypothetical protein